MCKYEYKQLVEICVIVEHQIEMKKKIRSFVQTIKKLIFMKPTGIGWTMKALTYYTNILSDYSWSKRHVWSCDAD